MRLRVFYYALWLKWKRDKALLLSKKIQYKRRYVHNMNPFESSTFGNSLSLRVDGAIGAMSLSPNGRDAVLAGRKGLFVIDLDDPFLPPRWLHHITSWEVADVQWSPHHSAKPSWCVSTSNQKALLWDLARPSNNAIQNVLHRHVRAITDINFHPLDPELLATCSIDTFVYAWDMRSPRRPVHKWAEWRAGATQVKWNRNNPYQIASSHHHSFYVWDSRKGALPLLKVENAHEGKINGLDFNSNEDRLISCSNDNTIRVWNLNNICDENVEPTVVIHTQFPVSRARTLPFGDDNCCGIMPVRGGSNAIHFVNYDDACQKSKLTNLVVEIDLTSKVQFKGHLGPVKDFLWRVQHEKYVGYDKKDKWKDFQLVTWSPTDYDLKLWPLEQKLYDLVDYKPQDIEGLETLAGFTQSYDSDSQKSNSKEKSSFPAHSCAERVEYNSYITEPQTSLSDLLKSANEDLLSQLALFEIKKLLKQDGTWGQMDHLDWISGVRIGGKLAVTDNLDAAVNDGPRNDGPSNLGEEISIVGHKFPKIRFEKISVSTGHIILSLRGPMPTLTKQIQEPAEADPSAALDGLHSKKSLQLLSPNDKSTSTTNGAPAHRNSQDYTNYPSGVVERTGFTQPPSDMAAPSKTSRLTDTDEGNNSHLEQSLLKVTEENKLIFIRLEIRFPKQYPHLKHFDNSTQGKRSGRSKKSNAIKFTIEETHELKANIRDEMLYNLNKISQFYTMKYNKYCLEPCLRYLLSDRIDLDDSLMMSNEVRIDNDMDDTLNLDKTSGQQEFDSSVATFNHTNVLNIPKFGNVENCSTEADVEDEDEYHDVDFITGADDELDVGTGLYEKQGSALNESLAFNFKDARNNITPLPKACSGVWTNSGKLVCFFAPKNSEELRKERVTSRYETIPVESSPEFISTRHDENSGFRSAVTEVSEGLNVSLEVRQYEPPEATDEDEDVGSSCSNVDSMSSSDFSDDWDEAIRGDIQAYTSMPSAFKETISFGRLRAVRSSKKSFHQTLSGKGTASVSSYVDDSMLRSTKKTKISTVCKHYIRVHDLSHLIPNSLELAKAYQLEGTSMKNVAKHNSEVASSLNHQDVGEAWKVIEMILSSPEKEINFPVGLSDTQFQPHSWGYHPFGHSWLVRLLFDYFTKRNNLQMLAMMSCVLFKSDKKIDRKSADEYLSGSLDPQLMLRGPNKTSSGKAGDLSRSESLTFPEYYGGDADLLVRLPQARYTHLPKSIVNHSDRALSPSLALPYRRLAEPTYSSSSTPIYKPQVERRYTDGQKRPALKNPINRNLGRFIGKTGSGSLARSKVRSTISVLITISNAEELDLRAGSLASNLLSCIDQSTLKIYRKNYAELLYSWGLPYERIQVLKFNHYDGSQNEFTPTVYSEFSCQYAIRNKKFHDINQELLSPLSPMKFASPNAWNTVKRSQIQYCSLCNQIVSKLVLFCLDCEHVLHFGCAASWWVEMDGVSGENCPTGCGCNCESSKSALRESMFAKGA